MSERDSVWVVDRLEGGVAVLLADEGGAEARVDRAELPAGVAEGWVLRVPRSAEGSPSWAASVRDEALEQARREEGDEALQELRKRDPGGDVVL